MVEGYCVRCKKTVEILSPMISKTSKGTNIAKGKCGTCSTTVCRMLGKGKE